MATKGSRLRFELGRLEVAGVVVSTAAGLFVVFLLGIYAGRGMAERRLEFDDQIVRVPVNSTESAPQESDKLTFYDTLAREEAAPHPEEAPEAAERLKEIVSAKTLGEEDLGERDEAPAARPQIAKPVAKAAPPEQARRPAAPVEEPKPRVAVALVDKEPAVSGDRPPPATGGEWSVQVAAPRDPRHAESIKRQLTSAGYRTYIVKTLRQGETFHRVRVGHYPSLDEARKVASLLRREPGVTGAFVASD